MEDMDNSALFEDWAVYIGHRQGDLQAYRIMQSQSGARENQEHFDISRYWNDRRAALPRLAGHPWHTGDDTSSPHSRSRIIHACQAKAYFAQNTCLVV